MNGLSIRVFCLTAIVLMVGAAPAAAQEGASQSWGEIAATYYVPCAANGVGESVAVTGQVHVVVNVDTTPSGRQHSAEQWNMVVSGAGLTTGDLYHGTWLQHISRNDGGSQYEYHERYALNLTGRGPGNNFRVEGVLRFVYDANGVPHVAFEDGRVVCG